MVKFVNLHYIRAAIQAGTGRKLSLREVAQYLYDEGLVSKAKAMQALHFSYDIYHPTGHGEKPLDDPMPIDAQFEQWTNVDENEVINSDDD